MRLNAVKPRDIPWSIYAAVILCSAFSLVKRYWPRVFVVVDRMAGSGSLFTRVFYRKAMWIMNKIISYLIKISIINNGLKSFQYNYIIVGRSARRLIFRLGPLSLMWKWKSMFLWSLSLYYSTKCAQIGHTVWLPLALSAGLIVFVIRDKKNGSELTPERCFEKRHQKQKCFHSPCAKWLS